MTNNIFRIGISIFLLLAFNSCSKETATQPGILITTATGNIQDELDAFRHQLGDQLNTTTGVTGGRREINWDALPDSLVGKDLPLDLFNPTASNAMQSRQRGLVYKASGQFRISNSGFSDINSDAAEEFAAFSGTKTFANISSNLWEIETQKPGLAVAAGVKGFGVVFSDVDVAGTTSLEFFDGNTSLGRFDVPVHDASSSFSFLGVYLTNYRHISRIRVRHDGILSDGQQDISSNGPKDLVVLDDLLYSEPVIP